MDRASKNKIKCEEYTIVISDDDDDETSKPNKGIIRRHSDQMKQKRKVAVNTKEDNIETLTITQKVKVKKQKIECVINLCTNVYDNSCNIKSDDKTLKRDLRRNVPMCCRKKCQAKHNIKDRQRKPKVEVVSSIEPIKQKSKAHHCRYNNKSKDSHKHKNSSKQKKIPKIKTDSQLLPKCDAQSISSHLSLSPISLSPIYSDNNMTYEDISLDSFTTCSESELDSLIKRTKERDRVTPSNDFSIQRLCCGTHKKY